MKKVLRALIAAACFPALIAAAGGITFDGGLNSSFSDRDREALEYSNRTGFNVGIGFEAPMSPAVFLVPELNLETRGEVSEQRDTPFGDIEGRLEMLYLQIPVFVMAKFPVSGMAFDVFAGPALGILLSAENTLTYAGGPGPTMDVKDDMQTLDLGIEMGLGAEFPVGAATFFIRPSYYLGLVDVIDTEDDAELYLRNLKLKAGIKVPL